VTWNADSRCGSAVVGIGGTGGGTGDVLRPLLSSISKSIGDSGRIWRNDLRLKEEASSGGGWSEDDLPVPKPDPLDLEFHPLKRDDFLCGVVGRGTWCGWG